MVANGLLIVRNEMVLEIANHYMVSDNLEYIIANLNNFVLKVKVS